MARCFDEVGLVARPNITSAVAAVRALGSLPTQVGFVPESEQLGLAMALECWAEAVAKKPELVR